MCIAGENLQKTSQSDTSCGERKAILCEGEKL